MPVAIEVKCESEGKVTVALHLDQLMLQQISFYVFFTVFNIITSHTHYV